LPLIRGNKRLTHEKLNWQIESEEVVDRNILNAW
jgi:hypothetical protein